MNMIKLNEAKEIVYDGPDTHVVYFLDLPLGNVLKVGTTTVRRLFNRKDECQRYFADDVKYLGIIYCDSSSDANDIERFIKNQFGTLGPRRNDLVPDSCEIRKFIDRYFSSADGELEISQELEKESRQ